jgi:transposase InsO family protein
MASTTRFLKSKLYGIFVTSLFQKTDIIPESLCPSINGWRYTSYDHTKILIENGIKISMDGKGRATDNIAIERFWRSAKYENIYLQEYSSIKALKNGVLEYIKFYNHKRFHQSLDYKKPMNVYNDCRFDAMKMAA